MVKSRSLFSLVPEDLVDQCPPITLPEARRLLSVVHRAGALPAVTPAGVRRATFFAVRETFEARPLALVERRPSSLDPFVKYAFTADGGVVIESVRIPLERENRFVVCVSSQAGCALGCAFCATGRLGLSRNLEAWEIVDQVRQLRADLPAAGRVHGVVFQGMGEPLANVDAVIQSVRVMVDSSLLAIDGRAITVCTAGLVRPLPKLLEQLPRVRLGISIGSAIPERRQTLMPVERSNPLAKVLDLAADHARRTHIAPMLAYTLLGGVNDGDDEIEAMVELLGAFQQRAGMAPRVSLIAYNAIGALASFQPSRPDRAEHFRRRLGALGGPVVRRYSGGADVGAACGQLGMELCRKNAEDC